MPVHKQEAQRLRTQRLLTKSSMNGMGGMGKSCEEVAWSE